MPREGANGRRLAGAPISWGVCEVPGWGLQLPAARVLAEMTALGLTATELGPLGYLGDDATTVRAVLDEHGLRLVGGFVPVVLHDPASDDETRAHARRSAELLAAAGAEVFVAAVVQDYEWSPRARLDDGALRRVGDGLDELASLAAEHGLRLVLHPHVGTLVETAEDVERMLGATSVPWCLDTGHLAIGGYDPVAFARDHGDRVGHVHLKDVDAERARRVRDGDETLLRATQGGLFRPLGQGDAAIADVLAVLDEGGYDGWLVLEQDTAITGAEPPVGGGPVDDVRASVDYLGRLAPTRGGTG